MKQIFNNNDLNNDAEKHLRADEMIIEKWQDNIQGETQYNLRVNDDGYFYCNESDRDFDYANAKRLFTKIVSLTPVNEGQQQPEFQLTQDGETLIFEGVEANCKNDWQNSGEGFDTETFFDWCKNSYPIKRRQQPVQGEGFTPGEWKVVPISDCCLTIQIDGFREDKKGGYIAEIKWERNAGGIGKEDEANARLIASAPTLYRENQQLKAERAELLKTIYHEIDINCISETENVSMTDIRAILVKHGANEPDLW